MKETRRRKKWKNRMEREWNALMCWIGIVHWSFFFGFGFVGLWIDILCDHRVYTKMLLIVWQYVITLRTHTHLARHSRCLFLPRKWLITVHIKIAKRMKKRSQFNWTMNWIECQPYFSLKNIFAIETFPFEFHSLRVLIFKTRELYLEATSTAASVLESLRNAS